MQTILMVEDDTVIATTVTQYLNQWGYSASHLTDFKDVAAQVLAANPDLVIMDIKLPFFNGFHWLEVIRRESRVPVLFLTSASDAMNLVMAMNMGADDFLAKPIELPVLLAKIQGLMRRTYTYQANPEECIAGAYTLSALDNRVKCNGQSVDLSPNETRILRLLFSQPDTTISRQDIMSRLWESDEFIDKNTLAVTITRLRQKVSEIGLDQHIQTVKGVGYRLAVRADA